MSRFTKSDLASPDDPTSGSYASDRFLMMLNELQDLMYKRMGIDLIINSACRTPAHNSKVGGASRSKHLTTTPGGCMAVDIHCKDDKFRDKLINAAMQVGFKGFGLANTFIHLDARVQDQASVWGYGSSTDWLMDKYEAHIRNGQYLFPKTQGHNPKQSFYDATQVELPTDSSFSFPLFFSWFKQDDMEFPVPMDAAGQLHHKEVKTKKNWLIFTIIGVSLLIILLVLAAIYSLKH